MQQTEQEEVVLSDRLVAVPFIQNLIRKARTIVIFVDPYFGADDLTEFALASEFADAQIYALTEGRNLKGEGNKLEPSLGDLLLQRINQTAQQLANKPKPMPQVKLMSRDRTNIYHDRFMVIDNNVWHFGHSFNKAGDGDISMATRLRFPQIIREQILEDIDKAENFIDGWPRIKTEC